MSSARADLLGVVINCMRTSWEAPDNGRQAHDPFHHAKIECEFGGSLSQVKSASTNSLIMFSLQCRPTTSKRDGCIGFHVETLVKLGQRATRWTRLSVWRSIWEKPVVHECGRCGSGLRKFQQRAAAAASNANGLPEAASMSSLRSMSSLKAFAATAIARDAQRFGRLA